MKAILDIQNLKCEGCESTIYNQLLALPGVKNLALDIPKSQLSLIFDTPETLQEVKRRLSKIGYPVVGDKNNVLKKATSYVSCAIGKITK